MFELAKGGHGQGVIARILHEEHPKGLRGKGWHTWTIGAILRSREVLGEYQMHTGGPGKNGRKSTRKPCGDPIPGFFPAIVPEADFYAVQNAVSGRRHGGGRIAGVPNLFSSVLHDARDGKTLVMNSSDSKRHLVSSGAIRRQPGSVYVSFPYQEMEEAILTRLRELKASDILPKNGREDRVGILSGKLAALNHKIAVVRRRADEADDITTFLDMIADYERQKKVMAAELQRATAEAASDEAVTLGETHSLIDLLRKTSGPERDALRLKIKAHIRQLVSDGWILTVARGRDRLAVVQLWFQGGATHRDYLVAYVGGELSQESEAMPTLPHGLDLRRPDHAARLEKALLRTPAADRA